MFYPAGQQQPQRRGRFTAEGPVPVLLAPAARADVPVYLDAVGTVKALNTVTVRPQVDGKLLAVGFKEGQDVKQGDVLARIDPTTYQAQLDQAVAKKAQDEAQLANAKIDLARYEKLAATNAINKQQADTQRAWSRKTPRRCSPTRPRSTTRGRRWPTPPSSRRSTGRTGMRMVDEGNIVHASDANSGIVVITQMQPISVHVQPAAAGPRPRQRRLRQGLRWRSTRCAPTTTR